MGLLDRLFGSGASPGEPTAETPDDDRAVQRYRHLLRTAPPATIDQVHAEAFARLSDAQRATIYEELSRGAGTGERPLSSEPATLARSATRAEGRTPGALERVVSAGGPTMFGAVAGYVTSSALVSAFLPWGDAWPDANGAAGSDAGSFAQDAGPASDSAVGSDFGDIGF